MRPFLAIQRKNLTQKIPKHLFLLLWTLCNVLLLYCGLKYLSSDSVFIFSAWGFQLRMASRLMALLHIDTTYITFS